MDLLEELVMQYLAKDPLVFLNPQYSIKDEKGKEWSCPDFVTIDFRQRIVSVIEVSARANAADLMSRLHERDERWLKKLRAQLDPFLATASGTAASWRYRVEVFVRNDVSKKLEQEFRGNAEVLVHSLEKTGLPWQWNWEVAPTEQAAGA